MIFIGFGEGPQRQKSACGQMIKKTPGFYMCFFDVWLWPWSLVGSLVRKYNKTRFVFADILRKSRKLNAFAYFVVPART